MSGIIKHAQLAACHSEGSWDCHKWAENSSFKKLPMKKQAAVKGITRLLHSMASKTAAYRANQLKKIASYLYAGDNLMTATKKAMTYDVDRSIAKLAKSILATYKEACDKRTGRNVIKQATYPGCKKTKSLSGTVKIRKNKK